MHIQIWVLGLYGLGLWAKEWVWGFALESGILDQGFGFRDSRGLPADRAPGPDG